MEIGRCRGKDINSAHLEIIYMDEVNFMGDIVAIEMNTVASSSVCDDINIKNGKVVPTALLSRAVGYRDFSL